MTTTESRLTPAEISEEAEKAIAKQRARMDEAIDRVSIRDLIKNTRRVCTRQWKTKPNWVLVMELTALGSTYSYGMCRKFGIDPEATTI